MRRGLIGGSTAGAALLALLLVRSSSPPPSPAESQPTFLAPRHSYLRENQSQRPGEDTRLYRDGPWKASQNHFAGISGGAACPAQTESSNQPRSTAKTAIRRPKDQNPTIRIPEPRSALWCIPGEVVVQPMIAIVPDPVHTRMALVFDRSIEAIQLAANTKGYVIDRYWLPWSNTPRREWTDYASYQQALKEERPKEEEPGLLLFRWNGPMEQPKAQILYVFLVSDTSTSGINGTQFSKAVDYFHELCASGERCSQSDPIRIMGPSFSGSLASLRAIACTFKTSTGNLQAFVAYSGTVSSAGAISTQGLQSPDLICSSDNALNRSNPKPGTSVTVVPKSNLPFKSFVNDTESAIEKLRTVLIETNCSNPPEIAILAEAGTAYGAVKEKEEDKNCYARFVYPREIASLRNAYPRLTSSPAGKNLDVAVSPFLTFDITDRTNSGDEPPDFSNPQGPLSKEAVLMEFATELRRNQYKYVGIIGSNVLDVLFLAKFLRQASPDSRLFVFSPDLLFERELDNAPYIGTLTVSTYPLVARNIHWLGSKGQQSRLPFADQYQEGQYNATLQTLIEMLPSPPEPELSEYYPPRFKNDQTPPALDTTKLPLWVTVVGKGGYWPIRLLSEEKGQETGDPAPRLESQDFTSGWKMLLALLTLLAVVQIALLAISSSTSEPLWDLSMQGAAPDQRIFLLHIACASLASALALLALPAWRFRSPSSGMEIKLLSWGAAIAVVGLCLIGAALYFNYFQRWRLERSRGSKLNKRIVWPTIGILTTWALTALVVFFWRGLLEDDPSHYGFFFAFRTVNLATGVSPFLPFFLLLSTVYMWSAFEIRRLRFDDSLRPRLGATLPGVKCEVEIAETVNHYALKPVYFILFCLFLIVWFLFFGLHHPFHLFERPEYGRAYQLLICLVVALMLSATLRLASIWLALRVLLRKLERSAVRDVFGRLKGLSWASIWTLGDREKEWIQLARSFEVVNQIKQCAHNGFEDGKLKHGIREVLVKREEISGAWKSMQDRRDYALKNRAVSWILRLPVVSSTFDYWTSLKIQREAKSNEQPQSLQLATSGALADDEVERRLRVPVNKNTATGRLYTFDLAFYELQHGLAAVLDESLKLIDKAYRESCTKPCDRKDHNDSRIQVYYEPEKRNRRAEQLQRLEEYVALRYMTFIRSVLVHIRYLVIFIAVSFSLVLVSLNIYSFEPHRSLIWSFTAIFVIIGLLIILVLMQIYRDYTLSRITGTTPDDLGMDFYLRIIATGAAPLLALLATHFPSIGRAFVSFIQPGLEALK